MQHGEQLVNAVRDFLAAIRACLQTGFQVFFHAEQWENFPALGNITNAGTGALFGGLSRKVLAVEFNAAAFYGQQAHDGFQQGGFAHAVAAHDTQAFAFFHVQVHIPESVGFAVVLIHVVQF